MNVLFLLLKMKKWRFLLGFGSETGQSKSIAQGMGDIASEQHQICADIFELDEIDKQVRHVFETFRIFLITHIRLDLKTFFFCLSQFKLEDEPVMVIVTSSTGDGEPPSNASKFWRKIRREKNPQFLLSLIHI